VTDLLTALARMLEAQPGFALMGAFLWGVASILLSPCHLAGVPLVVAYTGQSAALSSRRAAGLSTIFALGILVTVALVGAISVLAGRMLSALGGVTNFLVAALLFVVGLELLGAWPFHWSGLPRPETTRRGLVVAFLFLAGTASAPAPSRSAPVIGMTMKRRGDRAAMVYVGFHAGHRVLVWRAPADRCWWAMRRGVDMA
jgi:cytochrome c-type biogenesis protein